VWLEAPESAAQSVTTLGVKTMVLKEVANGCWSHVPVQDDQVEVTTCCWCGGGVGTGAKEGQSGGVVVRWCSKLGMLRWTHRLLRRRIPDNIEMVPV
jgi:hypothetical protein